MKILHYVDSLNKVMGGPARSVSRLAEEQTSLGLEVTLLANNYQELGGCLRPACTSLHLIPARRLPMRLGAWNPGFRNTVKGLVAKSDLIHIHGVWLPGNHQTAKEAIRQKKPFIVSPRGMLESWSRSYRGIRKKLVWQLIEKRLLFNADALHATADMEAQSLRALGLSNPILVIPNGVDTPCGKEDKPLIFEKFPGLQNRRILLFLSRLHPKKGVEDLLAAWASIHGSFPDWLLAIAGGDYDGREAGYRTQALDAGLADRVIFTGHIDGEEKSSLLAASELFVLPSYSENFGIAIAEALCAGLPVITTTATPWESIEKEMCGWRVPPGKESLQSTLSNALSTPPATLLEMGNRAGAFARTRFDWRHAAQDLAGAYRKILESHR